MENDAGLGEGGGGKQGLVLEDKAMWHLSKSARETMERGNS